MSERDRTLLVDASSFITLAEIGAVELLYGARGRIVVPDAVRREVSEDPARSELERAIESGDVLVSEPGTGSNETGADSDEANSNSDDPESNPDAPPASYRRAATHLDRPVETDRPDSAGGDGPTLSGDVALLGQALERSAVVVVTDDKPLRDTCKALSIPVSGSISVLVRAVERGDVGADEAKSKLLAMDEVGARLSARLLRRAERLIEDAAGEH